MFAGDSELVICVSTILFRSDHTSNSEVPNGISISDAVDWLILWICTGIFFFHLEQRKAKLNVPNILGRVRMQRFYANLFKESLSITYVFGMHLLTDCVT